MIRVSAPSRLHFGLLNNGQVPGVPLFGGCGLMIDTPGVVVAVEPAREWIGEGPLAARAVEFAKRVTPECHRVIVERCPSEHVGLGVGTSLGLAVAKAIRPNASIAELARFTSRGLRSGVGLYGFEQGGFIVDGGKQIPDELPRLGKRLAFPDAWRVVLARPVCPVRWHGHAEKSAFANYSLPDPGRHIEAMLLGVQELEAAIAAKDFEQFAEVVHRYNRDAGRWFEVVQGGVYSDAAIAELIEQIRGLGCPGVGQTSWGPTVFAFAADQDHADRLVQDLRRDHPDLSMEVTAAANQGASVSRA